MSETNYSNSGSKHASAPRWNARWIIPAAAVLCAAAVLVAWIESTAWRQMERLKEDLAVANLESFFLGVNLRESVLRMNGALFHFQLSSDEIERELFLEEARDVAERLEEAPFYLTTETERRLVGQLEKAFTNYVADTAFLLERGIRPIKKDTASWLNTELSIISQPLVDVAEELVDAQQIALNNFFLSSKVALTSLQRLLLLSVLLLGGLAAAGVAFLHRAKLSALRLQLNQSRALIERQEKLASLGVLAAGVAHEVRNPLTAIKFRLFSLKSSLPEEFTNHEDLMVVDGEINRLERIVKDFLQFARPMEPELASVPVSPLLQDVQGLLRGELEKRSIQLRTEVEASMFLRADKQQLRQKLINLIQNAADSIGQGGVIILAAHQGRASIANSEQPVVTIEVRDTGKGIPPEVQKRIFDPFFSTKEGGTGLGLSIASRIIEKHGGFIQYFTQPNRGTTFSLVLPRDHESAPSPH